MTRTVTVVGILFVALYAASTAIVVWKHRRDQAASAGTPPVFSLKIDAPRQSAGRERASSAAAAAAPGHALSGRHHSSAAGSPPPVKSPIASRSPTDPTAINIPPPIGTTDESQSYGSSFFPQRGTDEFHRLCKWTTTTPAVAVAAANCTILARPKPGGNEGISLWSVEIVKGYVLARQSGCRFLLDYGPGVDVRRVVQPVISGAEWSESDEGAYDWVVPPDFECKQSERCYTGAGMRYMDKGLRIDGTFHPGAPEYRFSYNPPGTDREGKAKCEHCLYPDSHPDLRAALPGYDLETAFACAYANLFRLASTAAEYEPRLFTDILPAVSDPNNLVVAAYIRSQQADIVAKREETLKKGEDVPERLKKDKDYRGSAEKLLKCVMRLEKQYLSGALESPGKTSEEIKNVVWVILTDNPDLKGWAVDKYDRKALRGGRWRSVLVTGARGVHTRTRRNPSTVDFAEAALDWYLIGESDLVVFNGNSFGLTAGLRTSRPIYSYPDRCSRKVLIHPANSTFRS